jgi:DNA modification methylase
MLFLPEYSLTTLDVIHCIDALQFLCGLPDNYVNCIVTSPPYFGLRNYQVDGQIGLEDTMQAYLVRLVAVFREARRVLRDDGVCFVNMGDSYAGGGRGGNPDDSLFRKQATNRGSLVPPSGLSGFKPKDRMMIPARLAIALQDDEWYLRDEIVWQKSNPMPESVTDRTTKAHEMVYMLSKNERYWFDQEAIREPAVYGENRATYVGGTDRLLKANIVSGGYVPSDRGLAREETVTRNRRSVWTIPTEATPFAHFATFPQALITPMILAGCPDKVCSMCGAPWVRETEHITATPGQKPGYLLNTQMRHDGERAGHFTNMVYNTIGFRPTCACAAETRPGICLDPFMGAGTTALVAMRLGRHYIGCDLSPEYVAMARRRLATIDPYQPTPLPDGRVQLSLFTDASD